MKSAILLCAIALIAGAQVPHQRLSDAVREPQNWLTYNGSYASTHYSTLDQIRFDNVSALELKWVWQANSLEKIEATPLVVDGVMYLTDPPNDVVAVDGQTGRVFWRYHYVLPAGVAPCCGRVNRGLAILGNNLYLGTLDAHLAPTQE
jgi:alcohol dehydrogenase (cytochrome c)